MALIFHADDIILLDLVICTTPRGKSTAENAQFASKVIDKDYYKCKACQNTTRISAVVFPYACKLLYQEIIANNILPKIRTDKT